MTEFRQPILPTRIEKKKTPIIQQQVMKHLSKLFVGFGFFPVKIRKFDKVAIYIIQNIRKFSYQLKLLFSSQSKNTLCKRSPARHTRTRLP